MCFNGRQMNASVVGVRELRQNLSVYMRRVQAGEALEVTDRGRPVAMLVPLSKPSTVVERLVASGRHGVSTAAFWTTGRRATTSDSP